MTASLKICESLDVHDLPELQLKAFWVLDKLSSDAKDRFSADEVATHLVEKCGVNTYRQAVARALEKDPAKSHKNKNGYKLMEPGRKALLDLISNRVIFIESGKPFSTKNIVLKQLFQRLQNRIFICDPYLDIHTLDLLFKNVEKHIPVRVLTKNIADKPPGTFQRHLVELRRERFQIEIGQHSASELHDRYIMDDHSFWLSGNSLNHLGNKESFLVSLGDDVRQSMLTLFNTRWSVATLL
jgi:hypothetical protein